MSQTFLFVWLIRYQSLTTSFLMSVSCETAHEGRDVQGKDSYFLLAPKGARKREEEKWKSHMNDFQFFSFFFSSSSPFPTGKREREEVTGKKLSNGYFFLLVVGRWRFLTCQEVSSLQILFNRRKKEQDLSSLPIFSFVLWQGKYGTTSSSIWGSGEQISNQLFFLSFGKIIKKSVRGWGPGIFPSCSFS